MRCELRDIPATARFTREQWAAGTKVEHEHTDDPVCAAAIAAAHLIESPDYYEALEKMERSLEHGGVGSYTPNSGLGTAWAVASVASTGLSAYHGYKRNNSVGWAIVWGLLGGAFPIITPAVAFAQGFGEPKGG